MTGEIGGPHGRGEIAQLLPPRLDQARAVATTLVLAQVCVLGGSTNASAAGIVDAVSCAPQQ